MLSRVANHTYWLGRYLERAVMDLSEIDRKSTWYQMIAVNSNQLLFAKHFDEPTEKNILQFLVTSPDNPSSIISTLEGARYNLRACRSLIPKALYGLINELCLSANDLSGSSIGAAQRRSFLREVEHQLLAISGAASGSMSYNTAFLFMRIGCFLERADMTSRIIDVRSANLLKNTGGGGLTPYENSQWAAILQSLQAFQMYMSSVRRPIQGPEVLNFVLKNHEHPKSFRFCVQRLASFIQRLPHTERFHTKVDHLLSQVDEADVLLLAQNQTELHQFIDDLQIALQTIANDINAQYFPTQEQVQEQVN